ncbi:MerR family transcriptional regulator [Paenarthrobacter ureafaciens]|uniref:MerR family transcriptional regulator n=1 Tax=Paenarthrobacter ureafaciens TaxID=37931 RepID=UPI001E6C3D87|nr:MerR family transcriptional regulator [Paenarthrobacter ureafaciens]MEC3854185.1 MerR family transcriptional regulator [Paenarthrobacter ureafaciens]BCW86418.1 MerR family transcriptional regulator [Arthrobacter sp. NicSoilE8]
MIDSGHEGNGEADIMPALKIGHVASVIGVSTARIRLWEDEGLITPRRTDGGQRRYSSRDVERLERIRTMLDVKGLTFRGVRQSLGDDAESDEVSLGPAADPVAERAKVWRMRRGMSLRELAKRTGISPSALSAFERGLSKPNTGRLSKIAHALDSTIPELLGTPHPEDQVVVRAAERESLPLNEEGVIIELLYKSSTVLQSQWITVNPGCGIFEAIAHTGEDFVTVVSGQLDLVLDKIETHHLNTGDSITFPSTRPHSFSNQGDSPTHLIWVNTPPTF